MSFFSKHTKPQSSDGAAAGNVASRGTSVEEAPLPLTPSRSFASPARTHGTHDTNTKRNRNRFPGCGFFPPTSDIYIYIYTYMTTLRVIRRLLGGGLGRDRLLRTCVEVKCWDYLWMLFVEFGGWDYLLSSSVKIINWNQLSRLSAEISCWDYLLRSAVETICWDQLLRLSVEIIAGVHLLRLSIELSSWNDLLR